MSNTKTTGIIGTTVTKTDELKARESAAKLNTGKVTGPARLEEATKQGFFGIKADPEPNESYTVAGVTKSR